MENEPPQLIGDFSTPDFFADESILFDLVSGTVRVTFATARPPAPLAGQGQALVATGRLIMPVGGAQRLVLALHDYLTKNGLDPSQSVRGDETAQ